MIERVKKAWNAFRFHEQQDPFEYYGPGESRVSYRTHQTPRLTFFNERSIIASLYTRIGIDFANLEIRHVTIDENDQYVDNVASTLNTCLTIEPNIDQGPWAFRQDIANTLFDHGVAAIVPVETLPSPTSDERFEILNMRIGRIVEWFPKHVKVNLYNENLGVRQDIIVEKRYVAIVENPLYTVMNEPNSTLQRLIRKLALLDSNDELVSSGKLDLIIQLPYVIKSEARRQQAEQRRQDIEFQLKNGQYGIAYTDGTEKITQLNRPAENNLLKQIEYLTNQLYTQLGITEAVMNGTAEEKEMLNYINRTIKPLATATTEAMQRSFLGTQGIANRERVRYFRNTFALVPVNDVAEIADKLSRNEILTANEIRSIVGFKPSSDPSANELRNSNMPAQTEPAPKAEEQSK